MRIRRVVELSVVSLLSVVGRENLGEPHAVFAGGERYVSPRFADEADRVLRRELDVAGLGERVAYREFLDLLAVVQRASVEFYGWVTTASGSYSLLLAGAGRSAVAVVRAGERVAFESADPQRLAEHLVQRLPDVPPARGDSISVLAADLGASRGREGTVMRRTADARPEGARRLDALLKAPRVGTAKLYAARRDRHGVRQRSPEWLTVLDLHEGRWAVYTTRGRGERAVNAVAGSPQLIVGKLRELYRSV